VITAVPQEATSALEVFELDGFKFDDVKVNIKDTEDLDNKDGDNGKSEHTILDYKKSNNNNEVVLYIAFANSMGKDGTATLANALFTHFKESDIKIDMAFMTGVAAGKKGKLNMGDLLVASSSFDCTEGKNIRVENNDSSVDEQLISPIQVYSNQSLFNQTIWSMYGVKDYYDKIKGLFPNLNLEKEPQVHYQPWMCLNTVESKSIKDIIKEDESKSVAFRMAERFDRKIIGLDMESAAFYREANRANIPALCIKGVSDYADDDKADKFHPFGKKLSASFVLSIIKRRSSITMEYSKTDTSPRHPKYCIICVGFTLVELVKKVFKDELKQEFDTKIYSQNNCHYIQGLFRIGEEHIEVVLTFTHGNSYTTSDVMSILNALNPTFLMLIGACSGNRKENIQIGDVLVVEKSFRYDTGKNTDAGFQPGDINSFEGNRSVLKVLSALHGKETKVPRNKRVYDKEWLLKTIVEYQNNKEGEWLVQKKINSKIPLQENLPVKDIGIDTLKQLWSDGMVKRDSWAPTTKGERFFDFYHIKDLYTFNTCVYTGNFASGSAKEERDKEGESLIFNDLKNRDCNIIGIDEESSSFLHVVNHNKKDFDFIIMKVVSDYADSVKHPADQKGACENVIAQYSFDAIKALSIASRSTLSQSTIDNMNTANHELMDPSDEITDQELNKRLNALKSKRNPVLAKSD